MTNPTDHTITAAIGEGLKVDIVYRYTPGGILDMPEGLFQDGPEMEVLSGTVLAPDGAFNDWTPAYVKGLAQDWLDDEGYDMAKTHAERERHGDYE